MNIPSWICPVGLTFALTLAVAAAPPTDKAEREHHLTAGQHAFRDNCLMCHSEELTVRSRLTEKQWATEVDKMIGWGAPVPPDLKGPLLDFLVSEYSGPAAKPVAPPRRISHRVALDLVRAKDSRPIDGNVERGAALYSAHCATCHGPDARGGDLGTSLIEKPVLFRPTDYHEVVRKGLRRMPGFAAALKPEQERDMLAWLRSRRFEAPSP